MTIRWLVTMSAVFMLLALTSCGGGGSKSSTQAASPAGVWDQMSWDQKNWQ